MSKRFWNHVVEQDECWVWTGARDRNDYGVVTVAPGHKQKRAHRFAFEQMVGPIPTGMQLDHLCGNKPCVNPYHMDVVTPFINNSRAHRVHGRYAVKP